MFSTCSSYSPRPRVGVQQSLLDAEGVRGGRGLGLKGVERFTRQSLIIYTPTFY